MTTIQQPSTKQDILRYLLKQGQATAQALSEQLQVSPQAIRRHLKDLEAENLIQHQTLQVGTGRPNFIYQLTPTGRSQFPDRYDEFAVSLLDTLAETVGQEQVSTILQKQWQRKAIEYRDRVGSGSLAERVARLVELRQQEGYMAECHSIEPEISPELSEAEANQSSDRRVKPASQPGGIQFVLTEYNCAISHIAESFPSVCGHELEMFKLALQDCQVERTHWLVNGEHRCGYLIQANCPPL
jgi:DeoR family transcriptional regulator, suf operon transcriptional repressor